MSKEHAPARGAAAAWSGLIFFQAFSARPVVDSIQYEWSKTRQKLPFVVDFLATKNPNNPMKILSKSY